MAKTAQPSTPPPCLKDYVFTEKLGSGTYATVYKAYKKVGSREVIAVKCVAKSSLNKISTENLLTEIELLKTLKHENIVQLKDFMWDAHYIYIMMELCSGGSLSRFLKSQRVISETKTRRFLQQIASALQYMRSMNVSHMDLKPQNILLSSSDSSVLKLADFGFAQYLMGETDAIFLRGSFLYMAPEIVKQRQYSEKADLWSIGVILYECIFGRTPFASRDMYELREKILDSKPVDLPPRSHVSEPCADVILRLLERDPRRRISFDEFFKHPFVDFEHRPCKQALDKAIELVRKAVENDQQENYDEAVNFYCQALAFFVPAIHYEKDVKKKQELRSKVSSYMKRAEELKNLLRRDAHGDGENHTQEVQAKKPKSSYLQLQELIPLCKCDETLSSAITTIESAQMRESREDYEAALEKYTQALETFLKILPGEPPGKRKDLMQSLVPAWMTRAESIKKYLAVKDLNTKDVSSAEEEEDASMLSQCCLQ